MRDIPTSEEVNELPDSEKLNVLFAQMKMLRETTAPVTEAYDSFIFGRNIAVGIVGVIMTVASNGNRYKVTASTSGVLTTTLI
jgi:hypothetical protein